MKYNIINKYIEEIDMYLCYIYATKNYYIYCQLFYRLIIVDNLKLVYIHAPVLLLLLLPLLLPLLITRMNICHV